MAPHLPPSPKPERRRLAPGQIIPPPPPAVPQPGPAPEIHLRKYFNTTTLGHLADEKTLAIHAAVGRVHGLEKLMKKSAASPTAIVFGNATVGIAAVRDEIGGIRTDANIYSDNAADGWYDEPSESVILVVVEANGLKHRDQLLNYIRKRDSGLRRTIGVIINARILQPGQECTLIDLVESKGENDGLPRGWHVLCYGTPSENAQAKKINDFSENIFFDRDVWSQISSADVGVTALRKKLTDIMYETTRETLPAVVPALETRLFQANRDLFKMGELRVTTEDLRCYLIDLAVDIQRLADDAIHGRYDDPFFGSVDDTDNKLRTHLLHMAHAFGATMQLHGAKYDITSAQSGGRFQIYRLEEHDSKALTHIPAYLAKYMDMYNPLIVHPETIIEADLNAKIQAQSASNRGEQACSTGDKLMMKLFRLQSSKWEFIAQTYAGFVTQSVRACMEAIVRRTVGSNNQDVTDAIMKQLVEPYFASHEEMLKAKIAELMPNYETSTLWIARESEFRSRLATRIVDRLSDHAVNTMVMEMGLTLPGSSDNLFGAGPGNRNKLRAALRESNDIVSSYPGVENQKVLDMMLTYYEMSVRTFTDNVVNLAVEPCLVSGVPGILTPKMVGRMSAERLEELVGETEASREQRKAIQKEITKLEEVLGVCRPHMPKEKTVLSFLSGGNPPAHAPAAPIPAALPAAPNGTNGASTPSGPLSEAEWLKTVPDTKYMDPNWYHDIFDPTDRACFQHVVNISFYHQEHSVEEIRIKDYSMGLGI